MNDYKDLRIWQDSIELVVDIYKLTKMLPKEEIYALTNQIRRAVVSIPSNIAEGANRNTNKEFVQFLYIALGSASEVETQLIIANRLGYLDDVQKEMENITKLRKMINALIHSIKNG